MSNSTLPNMNVSSNVSTFAKTPPTASQSTAFQLCYGLVGSVGLLENIGVIVIILRNRIILDLSSNWFVLNLAAADALTSLWSVVLVSSIPMYGIDSVFRHFVGFGFASTAGNLFILTFNRFLSVYDPLRYPTKMPTKRAKRLIFFPWVVALVLSAFNAYSNHANIHITQNIVNIYYCILIMSTTSLNIYMLTKARHKRKETKRLEKTIFGTNYKSFEKKEYRLAVRLFMVFLTSFGSWIPVTIICFCYTTEKSRRSTQFKQKFMWCALTMLLNTITNPYIYSIHHPIFNRYLRQVWSCFPKKCCKKRLIGSVNPVNTTKIRGQQQNPAITSLSLGLVSKK